MSSASATAKGNPEIDALFRRFEQKLPEPATLSESNGATLPDCDGHGGATYTLLEATAAKVPVRGDADLPGLVKWARHRNPCIRQIAIAAILPKIGFDRNALSAPGMHTPDDHHFHDIMVSLKIYLEQKQVAHSEAIFADLAVSVRAEDFGRLVHGSWVEEIDKKNFQDLVTVSADELRVTSKHTFPDPKRADFTWTTKIKSVAVNERRQFVVTGAWNVESNDQGYQGKRVEPSQFVYTFWPVAPGIVWFKNGEHAYWVKLRRAP